MHGHTLEASGVVELIVTVLTLEQGRLPLNANYLGEDADCQLRLVLDRDEKLASDRALSLNAAFGGANAVLAVSAP
jgi:3-oxoacyl-[acyl-carrier-protein] synthase II